MNFSEIGHDSSSVARAGEDDKPAHCARSVQGQPLPPRNQTSGSKKKKAALSRLNASKKTLQKKFPFALPIPGAAASYLATDPGSSSNLTPVDGGTPEGGNPGSLVAGNSAEGSSPGSLEVHGAGSPSTPAWPPTDGCSGGERSARWCPDSSLDLQAADSPSTPAQPPNDGCSGEERSTMWSPDRKTPSMPTEPGPKHFLRSLKKRNKKTNLPSHKAEKERRRSLSEITNYWPENTHGGGVDELQLAASPEHNVPGALHACAATPSDHQPGAEYSVGNGSGAGRLLSHQKHAHPLQLDDVDGSKEEGSPSNSVQQRPSSPPSFQQPSISSKEAELSWRSRRLKHSGSKAGLAHTGLSQHLNRHTFSETSSQQSTGGSLYISANSSDFPSLSLRKSSVPNTPGAMNYSASFLMSEPGSLLLSARSDGSSMSMGSSSRPLTSRLVQAYAERQQSGKLSGGKSPPSPAASSSSGTSDHYYAQCQFPTEEDLPSNRFRSNLEPIKASPDNSWNSSNVGGSSLGDKRDGTPSAPLQRSIEDLYTPQMEESPGDETISPRPAETESALHDQPTLRRLKEQRSNLVTVEDNNTDSDNEQEQARKQIKKPGIKKPVPKPEVDYNAQGKTALPHPEPAQLNRTQHNDMLLMQKMQEARRQYQTNPAVHNGATMHQFGLWARKKERAGGAQPPTQSDTPEPAPAKTNPFSRTEMRKTGSMPGSTNAVNSLGGDSANSAILDINRRIAEAQYEASRYGQTPHDSPIAQSNVFIRRFPGDTPKAEPKSNTTTIRSHGRVQSTVSSDKSSRNIDSFDSDRHHRSGTEVRRNKVKFWKKGELIGNGTFGKVFMGLHERTGKLFAIKQVLTHTCENEHEVQEMEEEIKLMKKLDHQHVVKYLGTERGRFHLYIFLEYVPGGSIASMLEQFGVFPEHLLRIYMYQIVAGMNYLHEKGIIHRDIKGANVLVNELGVAKLADFGCSKQLQCMRTASFQDSIAIKGSVPWMAPEVIRQTGHGRSADIWSAGVTMIEMATATHPWPHCTNNLAAMFFVASCTKREPPPIPHDLPEPSKIFLRHCLQIDPAERLSANKLLETDFLKGCAEEFQKRTESKMGRPRFTHIYDR